jgi:hypothetical protein
VAVPVVSAGAIGTPVWIGTPSKPGVPAAGGAVAEVEAVEAVEDVVALAVADADDEELDAVLVPHPASSAVRITAEAARARVTRETVHAPTEERAGRP